MKKSECQTEALAAYRAAPITGLRLSPSELLLGRLIRMKIPATGSALNMKGQLSVRNLCEKAGDRMEKYYNRTAKPLPELQGGQPVMVRLKVDNVWKAGANIKSMIGNRSYIVTAHGRDFRRNRTHLKNNSTSLHSSFGNCTDEDGHRLDSKEHDESIVPQCAASLEPHRSSRSNFGVPPVRYGFDT